MSATIETLRTVKNIALALSPRVPREHAYGLDSFTPAELTAAMAGHVPGARVERIDVEVQERGTTDRARLLLTWNDVGIAAGLPDAAFAKGTPSTIPTRLLNSAFGLCESEVRFYNELQPAVADMTMAPYVARLRTGGRFAIAIEMARSGDAEFFEIGDTVPTEHAEAMMDALALLHARYWRTPRFGSDLSWITVYARRPGWPIGRKVMPYFNKRWLQKRSDVPADIKATTTFFLDNQGALDRVWEALPPTLCHGDTHAANTYRRSNGTSGLFDWQNMHKLNGMRDVAYFIGWSLEPEVRARIEKDLISRYLDALAAHGVAEVPTLERAFELHRMFMIDAWNSAWAPLAIEQAVTPDGLAERLIARLTATLGDLDTDDALRSALARGPRS